jgi:hypothetical protein
MQLLGCCWENGAEEPRTVGAGMSTYRKEPKKKVKKEKCKKERRRWGDATRTVRDDEGAT